MSRGARIAHDVTTTVGVVVAGRAFACPLCTTGTGELVRAGIFDGNFVATMLGTVAPFPVLLAIVAALHFGWTPRMLVRRSKIEGAP
jgi:hypothetical protein